MSGPFSALRRVKTYLRGTMLQGRINDLMVLHIHKERTDFLDLKGVANDFISTCLRIFECQLSGKVGMVRQKICAALALPLSQSKLRA